MAAKVDKEKCTGCKKCVDACPVEAIEIKDNKAVINDNCVECSACISQCPKGAITIS